MALKKKGSMADKQDTANAKSLGETKSLPYVAHYWRFHGHNTEDFATLKEAKEFLDDGEEMGDLSSELIQTPKGYISGNDLLLIQAPEGCRIGLNVGKRLSQQDTPKTVSKDKRSKIARGK